MALLHLSWLAAHSLAAVRAVPTACCLFTGLSCSSCSVGLLPRSLALLFELFQESTASETIRAACLSKGTARNPPNGSHWAVWAEAQPKAGRGAVPIRGASYAIRRANGQTIGRTQGAMAVRIPCSYHGQSPRSSPSGTQGKLHSRCSFRLPRQVYRMGVLCCGRGRQGDTCKSLPPLPSNPAQQAPFLLRNLI